MPADATLLPESRFGSRAWVAMTLGRSVDWMKKNADTLETSGFPRPDSITGLFIKADVLEWIERRRQVPENRATVGVPKHQQGINHDAL